MTLTASAPQRAGRSGGPTLRGGWVELVASAVARSYLVFLATMAATAFLPTLFGWTGSVVQSGSMEPNVSAGDVVLTTPLPADSPLPIGRVITFHADDELVVHRLVGVNDDDSLVTKGDANPEVDPWSATRDDITGQGRLLVRYVGLPGFWLSHHEALPLALWGSLTLLAIVIAAGTLKRDDRRDGPDGAEPDDTEPGDTEPDDTEPDVTTAHPVDDGSDAAASVPEKRKRPVLSRLGIGAVAVAALTLAVPGVAQAQGVFTAQTRATASWTAQSYSPISVGAMAGYGAIANTSITDASFLLHFSTIYGSAATTPGTTVSNVTVSGTTDKNNAAATRAMAAATTARTAVGQRPVTQTISPTLSGTLTGGVYASTTGAFTLPGTVTLDAQGDSSARFVFRTTSTLAMSEGAKVVLTGGAKASNVWWIVGTSATLGTNTTLFGAATAAVGNYLVNGAANVRGITLTGRVVSYTGAVTMYTSTVTPSD
ncbi:signal peptidase I [Gryllotalpicola ginsengisoli]|uniref:signal peptidase I n=1 Tax=Gryllotalpicola ginsengisoli TaxID=444608 RepID=UPI0003B3E892|nr:signal peptidase I [Gryllotalpicola ginsengisoli]